MDATGLDDSTVCLDFIRGQKSVNLIPGSDCSFVVAWKFARSLDDCLSSPDQFISAFETIHHLMISHLPEYERGENGTIRLLQGRIGERLQGFEWIEKKITVDKETSIFEIVLGSDCDREGVAEWKERVEKEREFSITRRDLPHAEKCYSIMDKRSYGVRKERLEGIASELIGELKSSSSEDRLYLVVAAFREISRLHLFRMGNARSECLFFNLLMHQLKLCPVFPRTMTLFRGYTLESTLKEVIQGQQAFVSRFVDFSRFNLKLDAYERGMIEAAARNKQVESRATS